MGFTLGASLGFGLGFIVAHSRRAEAVLGPFIVGSQALPKTALAPLFVLWFGFGIMPKIILAATICFFPLFENTVVGLRRVDESYLKLFRSTGASTWQVFRYLRLINSTPLILISIRVSLLYALIGVVVGEFISGNEGLGFLVISAQGNLMHLLPLQCWWHLLSWDWLCMALPELSRNGFLTIFISEAVLWEATANQNLATNVTFTELVNGTSTLCFDYHGIAINFKHRTFTRKLVHNDQCASRVMLLLKELCTYLMDLCKVLDCVRRC